MKVAGRERRLGRRPRRDARPEGGRRARHHRPRLPGLPDRRELHRAPAGAHRRDVRRVHPDPAASRRERPSRRRCRSSRSGRRAPGSTTFRSRTPRARSASTSSATSTGCPTPSGCRSSSTSSAPDWPATARRSSRSWSAPNPTLAALDRVLAILASENHTLARLATESDIAVAPLAATRRQIADFIAQANVVATVSAQHRVALGQVLQQAARVPRRADADAARARDAVGHGQPGARQPRRRGAGRQHGDAEPRAVLATGRRRTSSASDRRRSPASRRSRRPSRSSRSSARSARPRSRSRRTPRRSCRACRSRAGCRTSSSSSSARRWRATATTRSAISCASYLRSPTRASSTRSPPRPGLHANFPRLDRQHGVDGARRARRVAARVIAAADGAGRRVAASGASPSSGTDEHPARLPARELTMSTTLPPPAPRVRPAGARRRRPTAAARAAAAAARVAAGASVARGGRAFALVVLDRRLSRAQLEQRADLSPPVHRRESARQGRPGPGRRRPGRERSPTSR